MRSIFDKRTIHVVTVYSMKRGIANGLVISCFAFSLAAGAFYESSQVKTENKKLKKSIEMLEDKVCKKL